MKVNWFAINRSIVKNELFLKKPLWGWAWVQILAETDYKTARVCLTEVYRDLSNHFSYAQWRHMINVFVKEGMLEINETVNLGDRAGHRQLATVSNWSKYQSTAQSEQQSEQQSEHRASTERNGVQADKNDTSTQSEHRASSRASTERVAVSIKNNFQEVKEVKESTLEAREPKSDKAYSEVAYAAGHSIAEWLRDKRDFDFVRAYALWGDQLESLWKAAVHHESRKPGDRAKFRFQDACEGDLDLSVKPKLETPEEDSAPPKVHFGDVVFHPEHGEFIADFEALYEDAWRCPEGYFIPSRELQVVRSTDA